MTVYDDKNDVMIHLMPLPGNVRAFSFLSEEGFVVVVNISLSPTAMRKTYRHELHHIQQEDHTNENYLEYN